MTLSNGEYELALSAFRYGYNLRRLDMTYQQAKRKFDKLLKPKRGRK